MEECEEEGLEEQEELLTARSPRSTAYIPPGRRPRTAPHAPSETGLPFLGAGYHRLVPGARPPQASKQAPPSQQGGVLVAVVQPKMGLRGNTALDFTFLFPHGLLLKISNLARYCH